MLAASTEVITPFQPKLIRINGIPHLITTVDSAPPVGVHSTQQTPSSIPHQTTPYWRTSTYSQGSDSSRQRTASAPLFVNDVYVFSKYFQERNSVCTVGFHPAVSSTRFRQNIRSAPHPVPAIRTESSGFLQLDIKPFHVKQFPETELLSTESLLALLASFDQDPERVNIPMMKVSGSVLNSVLTEKESTITIRLLESEIYSTFIGSNQKNNKQDATPTSSAQTDSSITSSPFEFSEASESDPLEVAGTLEEDSESDSEMGQEESMNIDAGLIQPVIEEDSGSVSSQSSSSSSSSSSTSSMMSQASGFLVSPFPMMPPPFPIGGMAGPPPLAGIAQSIGASGPSGAPPPQIGVLPTSPGLGNRMDIRPPLVSHMPWMIPYASAFLPFPRRPFPDFPDEITDASYLWRHVRNLVEFVLQEVNGNLQLSFIELLQRVLPEENHSWIRSLAALYQKRLTWFERNKLLSFSEEMMALSNGILPERIFFQISSIICLARISEASCERNVSRARAVFDRHKDRTLPTVANGLLLMSYHSLYKKLKAEKYSM